MLELHREMLERRNLAVLGTIMQTQRASVLEKQAAEVAFLHIELDRSGRDCDNAWRHAAESEDRAESIEAHNDRLEELVTYTLTNQRRVNVKLKELIDSYWAIINDCVDVCHETKKNARGQKRKLSATEQVQKLKKIIDEHSRKRARMVAAQSARGSTEH